MLTMFPGCFEIKMNKRKKKKEKKKKERGGVCHEQKSQIIGVVMCALCHIQQYMYHLVKIYRFDPCHEKTNNVVSEQ